jgi:hypothetical protein
MKNSYKLALLAVLGLVSASAAQAQTSDLIVGVYDPTVANTDVIDLGSASSLVNGETWNLSTLGLSSAGFSSTLNSGTAFGLAGYVDGGAGTGASAFYATAGASNTHKINGYAAFQSREGGESSVVLGSQTAGTANAWDQQVQPINSGTLGAALGYNVDEPVTAAAQFWAITDNNTSPVKDGTFSLNASTEVLTYDSVAVPEPTSYGLIAGAGLLIVSLRNKFSRKQA